MLLGGCDNPLFEFIDSLAERLDDLVDHETAFGDFGVEFGLGLLFFLVFGLEGLADLEDLLDEVLDHLPVVFFAF